MAILSRRALLALLVVIAGCLTASGCGSDGGAIAYFLMPEQRIEPKIKHLALAKDDKKPAPRVVILTWTAALETRPEFTNAESTLAANLGRDIKELAKSADEKIEIIPVRKVEDFKNTHPNWREMGLAEIGRAFTADHLIYLEINKMSLYEPGSNNLLMRGRANITVTLVDVKDPDDMPKHETMNCIHPGDAPGPVDVSDMQPFQFREKFLEHVSREISHNFSKYPRDERLRMD
jgi:hypothetical protein